MDSKKGIYFTPSLKALRLQKFGLLKPSNIKIFMQLFLGLQKAQRFLSNGKAQTMTLEECLGQISYFDEPTRRIFLCILCLISSMSCEQILASPADFFLNKLRTHNDVISPRALYSFQCVK